SAVKWNGRSRANSFVSASQLTATITSSDISAAGTAAITVFNSAPGGGTSNVDYFEVTNPTASLSFAKKDYVVGSDPRSVTVGDFNGDGRPDLAVANTVSNNVSVLLGNGDGTFQVAVNYAAGTGPRSGTVGEFNG